MRKYNQQKVFVKAEIFCLNHYSRVKVYESYSCYVVCTLFQQNHWNIIFGYTAPINIT